MLIAVLLVINFCTLVLAYPQTFKLDGVGTLAKDFSAYYIGSWRLLHDPAKVYTRGTVNDGEYQVSHQTQAYKYLPSFLVLLFPLLPLSYHDALIAFDIFQFMLLPLMAFLLYSLLGKKSLAVTLAVAVIVFSRSTWTTTASSASFAKSITVAGFRWSSRARKVPRRPCQEVWRC